MTTDAAHPRQAYEIIDGPAAWTGPEMAASSHWRHDLTAAEVADLRAAMDRVWARGLAIEDVGLDDFAAPLEGFAGEGRMRITDESKEPFGAECSLFYI